MAERWRLLDTGLHDAFYNMALDEAIAIARSKQLVPNTLRFFRWDPSAISIGYFQSMEDEVDISAILSPATDQSEGRDVETEFNEAEEEDIPQKDDPIVDKET